MKKFNCLGSRWHAIEPETNKHMQKAGYVLITRPATRSGLRKGHGQMVTAQSVKPESLPHTVRGIAENIVRKY